MINLSPDLTIPSRYANRHGLITGETGTGKSVTLLRLVEQFQAQGTPVFLADVKGDLGRIIHTCPVRRLDPYGSTGAPLRASPGDMGPELLARALELTDAQSGTLELLFHAADLHGWPLDSVTDLRTALATMLQYREAIGARLGQVSPASVAVIQRNLLRIAGDVLSGPSFDVARLLEPGVTLLDATRLYRSPRLYAALLMFMLGELDRRLPEVGDLDRPRLAFFFDEAHLLFRDVPPALLLTIERTVRLIRSKGVGIYFASQRPGDVPEDIRDQLAHRVEHSRALGIGRANVRTIGADGRPVERRNVPIAAPACLRAPVRAVEPRPLDSSPVERRSRVSSCRASAEADSPLWSLLGGFLALALVGCGIGSLFGFGWRESLTFFAAIMMAGLLSGFRSKRA